MVHLCIAVIDRFLCERFGFVERRLSFPLDVPEPLPRFDDPRIQSPLLVLDGLLCKFPEPAALVCARFTQSVATENESQSGSRNGVK